MAIMKCNSLTLALICLVLASCTTVGQIQASCEATSKTFLALADCLKVAIADSDSSRMKNSPEVKLYLLKAEQLSQRVRNNEMSDLDARVELQTLYVNIKGQEDANRAARAAASAAGRAASSAGGPKTATCFPVGNTVQCNYY
ncbi:MAG: hypothetical protein Q7R45_14955 [Sulfuricaulis sp.]|nr:hypothetical protein [Sulfuricaulis sp.]